MTRLAILRPVSGLSARQERILWAMNDYRYITGFWPTVRELIQMTENVTTSTIHYNLHQLASRGMVGLDERTARSARLAPTVAFARVGGERRVYEAVP